MLILFLVGGSLLFGNAINPDIQSDTANLEASYYYFRDSVPIKQNEEEVERFEPSVTVGWGASLYTHHRIWKNWRNTLSTRRYRSQDFRLAMYSTGFDYMVLLPKTPIRLSVGFEIGTAELKVNSLQDYGDIEDTWGGEIHTEVSNYFVFYEQLWNYFIRPSLRFYQYPFEGKQTISNEMINGDGLVVSAGIGMKF